MFNLPNLLTVSNLFFGCCALVSLNQGKETQCILFVLLAAIVDFMDGFVARKMKQESELGAQLDSLSDVVTFGVVPGMICFYILRSIKPELTLLPYTAFLLTLSAAFRLARFNIDSTGHDLFFTGLPVPANALFFCGILQVKQSNFAIKEFLFDPFLYIAIIILFSYLMISQWKILKIHLKKEWFKKFGFIVVIEIISLASVYWIGAVALSLVILIHISCSLFIHFYQAKISIT